MLDNLVLRTLSEEPIRGRRQRSSERSSTYFCGFFFFVFFFQQADFIKNWRCFVSKETSSVARGASPAPFLTLISGHLEKKICLYFQDWTCPPCRRICNCSFCRARAGKACTGILIHLAREHGYNDVNSFLQRYLKDVPRYNSNCGCVHYRSSGVASFVHSLSVSAERSDWHSGLCCTPVLKKLVANAKLKAVTNTTVLKHARFQDTTDNGIKKQKRRLFRN